VTTPAEAEQYIGRTAVDSEGNRIGKIGQAYLDYGTGEPLWVTVATGLFGTRQSFAPIYGSHLEGDDVILTVTRDQVKDAPNVEDDAHISETEEDALYQYYASYVNDQPPGQVEYVISEDAMAGSEERPHVGTESAETARMRIRKHMVTGNVATLLVGYEEVRAEREPTTDVNRDAVLPGEPIAEH
jgi:PRC-barrel domain/Domain of unknown function (DUF2382)